MVASQTFLFLSFLLLSYSAPVIPVAYPLYMQCDHKWGTEHLGTSSRTICQDGCAMSDVAMALSGYNETLPHKIAPNPETLNRWLITNGGYVDGDLIVWNAIHSLGSLHLDNVFSALSSSELQHYVKNKQPVVVNVHNGAHWVLVTGYDTEQSDLFYVNDPFYPSKTYNLSSMIRFVVYKFSNEKTQPNLAKHHQKRRPKHPPKKF